MLDPKVLRETPDLVRAAIAKKHLQVDLDAVLAVDRTWRAQLQEVEQLRGQQKAANAAMAALPKGSPEFLAKVAEMKAVSAQVKEREARLKETEEAFHQAMLTAAEPAPRERAGGRRAGRQPGPRHPRRAGRPPRPTRCPTGRSPASSGSSTLAAGRR